MNSKRINRLAAVIALAIIIIIGSRSYETALQNTYDESAQTNLTPSSGSPGAQALKEIVIKGRAPKTGYDRKNFSNGWANTVTCDMRNRILQRDLESETLAPDNCVVLTGTLHDPYTNKVIQFTRGETTSDDVQIDHVVAVSDAWQKGAQQLTPEQRFNFYNDPLNLLAVDGPTNNKKGDSDAATWLPPNKTYRCDYVARQIAVKQKYSLWVTSAEFNAIDRVLANCPDQNIPKE